VTDEEVGLRDARRPGHLWADNELFSVFAPVIGGHAVLVYVTMCASLSLECEFKETRIRASSRQLAAMCGLGKDSVRRAMHLMERLGMLQAKGAHRKTVEYHLVDLKDLAMKHGGSYERRRASYVLTSGQMAKLKALAYGAATGAVADSAEHHATGAVADSGAARPCATSGAGAASGGAGADSGGAAEAHASFNGKKEDEDKNKNPTPTPSQWERGSIGKVLTFAGNSAQREELEALKGHLAKEEKFSPAWWSIAREVQALQQVAEAQPVHAQAVPMPGAELSAAELAAWVMQQCSFQEDARLQRVLYGVLRDAEAGARPVRAAEMAAAWQRYTRLPARWGPGKFFAEGHWQRPNSWPKDDRVCDPCAPKCTEAM
jgi:hypothetical protein